MIPLFTYGTLEIPEVMEAVTGRTWTSAEAWAKGFGKFLLKGRIYPGMTSVQEGICSGRIYYHIDRRTLDILDAFEDEVYTRKRLEVEVEEGRSLQAYAYLIPADRRDCLTSTPWKPEEFKTKHLVRYLEACKIFHRDVSGRPKPALPVLNEVKEAKPKGAVQEFASIALTKSSTQTKIPYYGDSCLAQRNPSFRSATTLYNEYPARSH